MYSVSVIIPTLSPHPGFSKLLDVLAAQTVKPSEIFIVDSGSNDGTTELAQSRACTIIRISEQEFDHGGTRNIAVAETNSEFIVFLTQDALPCDEYALENIIKPFSADSKIGAAFGKQLPYPNASVFAQHLRLFNYPDASYTRVFEDRKKYGIKTAFLSNSFAAYRKSVLEEIGYFKNALIFGEDTDAGARMLLKGYKIAYVTEAKVYHSHNYTIRLDFRRYFDLGVFHRSEDWILEEFGKAGAEGIKYAISEAKFLLRRNRFALFPEFLLRTLMKYLGYKLGRQYVHLPRSVAERLSMNSRWWGEEIAAGKGMKV